MIDVAKDELIDHIIACKALGNISYQTFADYVRSGDLEAVKNRGKWFTTYAAINNYMRREAQKEIDRLAAKSSASSDAAEKRKRSRKAATQRSQSQIDAANNLRALGLY